jgi:hypothetical protein
MNKMTNTRLAAAVLVALAAAACSSVTDPSKNVPETFTGSVQPNSFGPVHQFNISTSGELTVTVTSIVPGSTSGASCGSRAACGRFSRTWQLQTSTRR